MSLPSIPDPRAIGEKLFLPPPNTILMPPHRAPQAMLDRVEVHPDGHNLRALVEGVGAIALEIYHWDAGEGSEADQTRARFSSPLTAAEAEAETQDDAPLATKYPYAVLPNKAPYAAVVHAPQDAIDTEWSAPHDVPGLPKIASSWHLTMQFPELQNTGLVGEYSVDVQQQTLRGLAMAVRLDNGEPQLRRQVVNGLGVQFHEMMAVFHEQPDFPGVVTAAVNARTTHKEPKAGATDHEVDVQKWEARLPDGFQKEGTDGKSGLVEVIVFRTTRVRYGELKLTPFAPPEPTILKGGGDFGGYRGGYELGGNTFNMRGGLGAMETRYQRPVTVKAKEVPTVKEALAVAAFRAALVGSSNT